MNERHDGVERTVAAIVAAALDRPGPVDLAVPLHDLGAESLDFLDIAFRLEKEYRVRMPRLNVLQRAEEHYGAGTLVKDGLLTEFGLEVLRHTMPEVAADAIRPGLRAAEVGRLISAATFVRVVRRLLEAKLEVLGPCPACGGALEESASIPEAACAGCGRIQPFPAGDEILLRDLTAVPR